MRSSCLLLTSLLASCAVLMGLPVRSQITPDQTLGAESSVAISGVDVEGALADLIVGGAVRDANLFHSFLEFNIGESDRVYFESPAGIDAILGRVTGGSVSAIDGLLGTAGASNAALILMNPNGIVFGENAQLDVQGAFTATTATGIRLGETGFFSATNPADDNLLSIQPTAFFFSNLIADGNIEVLAGGITSGGLRVPNGESLRLFGRDILLDGGWLNAWGGQVALGAVRGAGEIMVEGGGRSAIADGSQLGDIRLENFSLIDVQLDTGGEIHLLANDVDVLSGSQIKAGIEFGFGTEESQAGDLRIDAAGAVMLSGRGTLLENSVERTAVGSAGDILINSSSLVADDGAVLETGTFGSGSAGDIVIQASDRVSFLGDPTDITLVSGATSDLKTGAQGTGGDIRITASDVLVAEGGQISASTFGDGDAGSLVIQAQDSFVLEGSSSSGFYPSGVYSDVGERGVGEGGDVRISAESISVLDGAQLNASTFGNGDAGRLVLQAQGDISLMGRGQNDIFPSGAFSDVGRNATGNGGEIEVEARRITISEGALLIASTFGAGDSGDVTIRVLENAVFEGGDRTFGDFGDVVSSSVSADGRGNGGDVSIEAGSSVRVANGAQISADTRGIGDAGSVMIQAQGDVVFEGLSGDERSFSGAFSDVGVGAVGKGGDIVIDADSLTVSGGARLDADTKGTGDAGSVVVRVRDIVVLAGAGEGGLFPTRISSRVAGGAEGNGGDVSIEAGDVVVFDGAQLSTGTFGVGDAGNIVIRASGNVVFFGTSENQLSASTASTTVTNEAQGRGGDISISANSLSVVEGAQLVAATFGEGDSGDITIETSGPVTVAGSSENEQVYSTIFSTVGAAAIGDGGGITIEAGSLLVAAGSHLESVTLGQGDAGDITIRSPGNVAFTGISEDRRFESGAFSSVRSGATGDGGTLQIAAGSLDVVQGAVLSSNVSGTGDAGDIVLNVRETAFFEGNPRSERLSGAYSNINEEARGAGGDIELTAENLYLAIGGNLFAGSFGAGPAGSISLAVRDSIRVLDSAIGTNATFDTGGQIQISADDIVLYGDSDIQTFVSVGDRDGGRIAIAADSLIAFDDSDILAFSQDGAGGDIDLQQTVLFSTPLNPISESLTPEQRSALDNNGRVDVNATGATRSGQIFARSDVFVDNNLVALSDDLVNTEALVAGSCIARRADGAGALRVTGSDRTSQSPTNSLSPAYPLGTVQPVSAAQSNAIQEPQAIYQLANGRLVISHRCDE